MCGICGVDVPKMVPFQSLYLEFDIIKSGYFTDRVSLVGTYGYHKIGGDNPGHNDVAGNEVANQLTRRKSDGDITDR